MLEKQIKDLFAAILQVDPSVVNNATAPNNLAAWDSINHLNLIAVFEEKFSIDIDPADIPLMMENFVKFRSIISRELGN